MTREEAAEVILRGTSCLKCSACHGEGWIKHKGGYRMLSTADFCGTCSGVGAIRHPEYEEAAIILGMEYPDSTDWVLDDD